MAGRPDNLRRQLDVQSDDFSNELLQVGWSVAHTESNPSASQNSALDSNSAVLTLSPSSEECTRTSSADAPSGYSLCDTKRVARLPVLFILARLSIRGVMRSTVWASLRGPA